LDYRFYQDRLLICDIKPRLLNITVVGRVEKIDVQSHNIILVDNTGSFFQKFSHRSFSLSLFLIPML